ncbi:MAG: c-type cytochrome [Planctomycetaceae bacterium]|nr:c-type cytochrome [Planctomycetaceae bacterium]
MMGFSDQMKWTRFCCALLLCLLSGSAAWSVPPEEEDPELGDFPPGLVARYQQGTSIVKRIDPDISFDWGKSAPDVRLNSGPFEASWQSLLMVRLKGEHRFHVYLAGKVSVLINGKVVLEGTADQPGWITGEPIELPFGDQELEVRYQKTGELAVLKLCWFQEQFFLEPISTHLLSREVGDPELSAQERGQIAMRAGRCLECHASSLPHEHLPAPALTQAAAGLDGSWIRSKLLQPAGEESRMPHFDLTQEQAADIAAFLSKPSKETVKLKEYGKPTSTEDREEGELLVHQLGCLACHQLGELGQSGPFAGGRLDQIASKRSTAWLARWLENPASLNSTHRMPQVTLSKKEHHQVVAFLSSLVTEEAAESEAKESIQGDPERGKTLVNTLRCAACHELEGLTRPEPVPLSVHWSDGKGCLAEQATTQSTHPHYWSGLRDDLEAWWKSIPQETKRPAQFESDSAVRGRLLLHEKNCLSCHPRDRGTGISAVAGKVSIRDDRLQGQSQGLIPPHLTAVGDRLHDEAITKGIEGKLPRRLPWLFVRMPQYTHTPEQSQQLRHHLIGHDRLPDPLPDSRLHLAELNLKESEQLLVGRELTGGRAFNCIACHQFGSYQPRNTALGTRGSDLLNVGERIRLPYFLRWTASPLRIVPGMEMPSYNLPKPGFPVETSHEQLSILWNCLNRPDFQPPSNPAVVEQFLALKPGDQPRVIRDVFELQGMKDRTYLPRPLAIGFGNGHGFLFDCDTAAVREWTYGDFAAQQTEGKSWQWMLAGASVVTGFSQVSDWGLRKEGQEEGELLAPEKIDYRHARLFDYQILSDGVQFRYQIQFQIDGKLNEILVTEQWYGLSGTESTGVQRQISATPRIPGYELVLSQLPGRVSVGEPLIENQSGTKALNSSKGIHFPADRLQEDVASWDLTYRIQLSNRSVGEIPQKPEFVAETQQLDSTPGFTSTRLPLGDSVMPTSFCWTPEGKLLVTSLKGNVFQLDDENQDGLLDSRTLIAEGLAAPFGLICHEDALLVAHKPEVLQIKGWQTKSPEYSILADGWGHTDNYHDWVTGFGVNEQGKILFATGSDYAQPKRDEERRHFRGRVLQLESGDQVRPIASALRYPMGIASDSRGRVFVSDQQGVQNCFNEINYILPDHQYGVPGLEPVEGIDQRAAIQIPHPWTRSVNGIFFIPDQDALGGLEPFRGHGVGCEYNHRFLVRFSLQEVNGGLQGACYALTIPHDELAAEAQSFLGPMSGTIDAQGNLYIGSISDSGWIGGQNTGEIVKMVAQESLPNGIRELTALPNGFQLEWIHPLPADLKVKAEDLTISGYTRIWEGDYATPDSGRYRPEIRSLQLSEDRRKLVIEVDELRKEYLYEFYLNPDWKQFPSAAFYTMNQIPQP